jgi:hypothetical protein
MRKVHYVTPQWEATSNDSDYAVELKISEEIVMIFRTSDPELAGLAASFGFDSKRAVSGCTLNLGSCQKSGVTPCSGNCEQVFVGSVLKYCHCSTDPEG